ncbi:carbohydrate-binding module family 13 protein [Trichoderma citrinoviride]|uniref:Carbohydrate-binding module family 13 protein n=1 Tax=Trichoderma citrinoviride TaxID=58853 RepID=A0A2T4B7J2_9HYPO|nr:carbohydrate-binding module family 13 protein [Trichoderma citrinoviride]PTB65181.1 carbohydrate-binding module family 13 protein [Trichoderma citrinoviride]
MPLKDGIYIISSTLPTNPVLDIDATANPFNSPISGVVGFTRDNYYTTNKHQQWVVTTLRRGVYSLKSTLGNVWITAPADGVSQLDTSVYDSVHNEDTRWKITNITRDTYQIESVPFPDCVIDLQGGSSADNTHAILYPNIKSANQIWRFLPVAI